MVNAVENQTQVLNLTLGDQPPSLQFKGVMSLKIGGTSTNGRAIQPLSTVHGAQYADYSHGIRLISRTAYVNGRAVDLATLLGDGELAGLISDERPIRV